MYLIEQTPLSERQAEVLALKKTGHSTDEISDILTLPVDTVEDHLDTVLNQLDAAQEFCMIMKSHPGVDIETRQNTDIDDTPFNLLSSAVMHQPDEEHTRIELELHHALTHAGGDSYLLIEREVIETADWATQTTEERSAHAGSDTLRRYIHNDVETLDEYYLRDALLRKAGIDPGATGARSAEDVLNRDISSTQADAARERALDRTTRHSVYSFSVYHQ
jgi:transcriptional regulator